MGTYGFLRDRTQFSLSSVRPEHSIRAGAAPGQSYVGTMGRAMYVNSRETRLPPGWAQRAPLRWQGVLAESCFEKKSGGFYVQATWSPI